MELSEHTQAEVEQVTGTEVTGDEVTGSGIPEVQSLDDVAKIKAERDNALKLAKEKELGFITLQREFAKKDKEAQSLKSKLDKLDDLDAKMELLASYVSTSQQDGLESSGQPNKPDLKKAFEQMNADKHQKETATRVANYQTIVESELGLTSKDEDYWKIHELVTQGKFNQAEAVIEKVRNIHNPKGETKVANTKQTEEERINKLAEEKARKYLEEKGLLKPDKTSPSGSNLSFTREQIKRMSIEEYAANEKAIRAAMEAGRVK